MPKISVIVPVYKVEKYLARCIDSILAQTYKDYEIILVDDGSPDDCGRICDEYAEKYDNIRVIHKENGGLSSARNAGIDYAAEHSDSEWLTFVDSDDYLHPRYLEQLYLAAVENGVNVSACAYVLTDGVGEVDASQDCATSLYTPEQFWVKLRGYAVVSVCKLYAKSLFDGTRFPCGKLHEDEFTTHKLLFACDKVAVLPAQFYYYFQNNGGIMHSAWSPRRLDGIEAIEQQLHFFKEKKYKKAHKNGKKALARVICTNMQLAQACAQSDEYAKIILRLQQRLKKHMLKNYFHIPIRYCQDIYIAAFPKRKKLILLISGTHRFVINVIKKVLRKLRR